MMNAYQHYTNPTPYPLLLYIWGGGVPNNDLLVPILVHV